MLSKAPCNGPRIVRRAAFLAATVLGVYLVQLGATILHVSDEHHTFVPVHHHDDETPDHDQPTHDGHSVWDHLDEMAYRRSQIDDVPVAACNPSPEVDLVAPLSAPLALRSLTPTGVDPSPGPPARAPPTA